MNDETDKFLDVTQAAEKMYEALSELRQRTEDYSEAGQRLESAAVRTQALADATTQVLDEQGRRWDELRQIIGDQVRPALDRVSDNAEKQTVHLSSLSGAVAGQQNQLTLVQQALGDSSRVLSEMKPSLARLEAASGEQSKLLQGQSETLEHQQMTVLEAGRRAKNASYAAIWAALISLAALIALVVHLVA